MLLARAIDTFTRGLANEMCPQGVRVNAVRPRRIYIDRYADGAKSMGVKRLKDKLPLGGGV